MKRLSDTNDRCESSFQKLQSRRKLLDDLQPMIPELVAALGKDVNFRMCEEDARKECVLDLEARESLVEAWIASISAENQTFFATAVASKSVLFQHFLAAQRGQQRLLRWQSAADFNASLTSVREHLSKLLRSELSFDELKAITTALDSSPVDQELLRLVNVFPNFKEMSAARDNLRKVLQLLHLHDPLQGLVQTLQRFKFACARDAAAADADVTAAATDDADFRELAVFTDELDDRVEKPWGAAECDQKFSQIAGLLFPDGGGGDGGSVEFNTLLGLLSLFQQVASADQLWGFLEKNKDFIAEDGLGYSSIFNEKAEDFLAQLGGEEYKLVYNFKTAACWVATLLFYQGESSFRGLMHAVVQSRFILAQVIVTVVVSSFPLIVTLSSSSITPIPCPPVHRRSSPQNRSDSRRSRRQRKPWTTFRASSTKVSAGWMPWWVSI
jgi:hypothetical protein